jgi:hypothetical protein
MTHEADAARPPATGWSRRMALVLVLLRRAYEKTRNAKNITRPKIAMR